MPLRLALLLLVTGLVAGCVSSGHDSPLQTGKGRDEARVAYVQLGLGYLRQGMSEQAKVVKELLEHHIKEEETEMFPQAKKLLGNATLQELGKQMEAMKAQHKKQAA